MSDLDRGLALKSGVIRPLTIMLDNQRIKTLPNFPAAIELIPTPRRGRRIVLFGVELVRHFTTGYMLEGGQSVNLRCLWGASDLFPASDFIADAFITGTGVGRCFLLPYTGLIADSLENKEIVLHDEQEGAPYTGGHEDNTMIATAFYVTAPVL